MNASRSRASSWSRSAGSADRTSSTKASTTLGRAFGSGYSAIKGGDQRLDLGGLFRGGRFTVLDGFEQIGAQSDAVGGFLDRQVGPAPGGVDLLAERGSRCARGALHQGGVAAARLAQGHDDRRGCPAAAPRRGNACAR